MAKRLRAVALALAILVFGFGFVVAVTEYQVGANAAHSLLTTRDVIRALEAAGLAVDTENETASHPLIGVAGKTLIIGTSTIEVYVFPSVRDRVSDEQVLQRYILSIQTFNTTSESPFRITSAQNILLLIQTDTESIERSVFLAARALSSAAGN